MRASSMLPPPVDIPKYATMATVTTPEVKSAAQQHKEELWRQVCCVAQLDCRLHC